MLWWEEDYSQEPATVTIITQGSEGESEEEIDAQCMITGWTEELAEQVTGQRYPEVNPITAAHELYGFKVALPLLVSCTATRQHKDSG